MRNRQTSGLSGAKRRRRVLKEIRAWLGRLVGPAFILGGLGVMPTFFWIGVSCIYVGIILLFVEIAIEPSVRQWTRDWRYFPHIWAMLCLIALGMFSTHVVFKSY